AAKDYPKAKTNGKGKFTICKADNRDAAPAGSAQPNRCGQNDVRDASTGWAGWAATQPRWRSFSRFPVFHAEFQNREVPSAGCLNNTANIPIKNAIQIYPSNASDAATNRASVEGRTSP